MGLNTIDGDMVVKGRLSPTLLDIPDNIIVDADVSSSAKIATTKLQHRHQVGFGQPNTAATTETRSLFIARSIGTIMEIGAGSIAIAIGNSTVTVNVLKNGTTVLTAVITLDNANVARTIELGTISVAGLVAGDYLEVVLVATIGTGTLPTGVFVSMKLDMDP